MKIQSALDSVNSPLARTVCIIFAISYVLSGQVSNSASAVENALASLTAGDAARAERTLRDALKTRPNDGEIMSVLGLALDSQKRLAEADTVHRQAIAA